MASSRSQHSRDLREQLSWPEQEVPRSQRSSLLPREVGGPINTFILEGGVILVGNNLDPHEAGSSTPASFVTKHPPRAEPPLIWEKLGPQGLRFQPKRDVKKNTPIRENLAVGLEEALDESTDRSPHHGLLEERRTI
nr:hypothetical protein Iba_chr10eCG8820 [Ipomoea batatas]